mgnify:CR=1 FL=1
MKKENLRRTAAILSALALFGASFTLPAGAASAEIQKYKEKISALSEKQDELWHRIGDIDSEKSATLDGKKELDALITATSEKAQAAQALQEVLGQQISDTAAEIERLESEKAETMEKMKVRMRANQDSGKAGYLQLICGSVGIGDFLSRLERVNTVLEFDKNTAESLEKKAAELAERKSELEEAEDMQTQLLAELNADIEKNKQLAAAAEAYYEKLSADSEALRRESEKAKASEEALNAELERLLKESSAPSGGSAGGGTGGGTGGSPSAGSGKFIYPLPVGGYISCRFGDPDPNGAPHWALDVAIAAGTPVYAAADGKVLVAKWHDSYGNFVLIDHGGGYSTLYAHFSSIAVSAGQSVSSGQVIGYVGTTGFSKGNHLHFEFRVNGQKKNPLDYVPCPL